MSVEAFREQLVLPKDRIIVAYDGLTWPEVIEVANEIGGETGFGKTNSANVRAGADYAVRTLAEAGMHTMLDYKFHDIPQTVEYSVKEATLAGGSLITVHASGGVKMMQGAVKGRNEGLRQQTDVFKRAVEDKTGLILGITVLTSLDTEDCVSIFGTELSEEAVTKKVLQFAHMAQDAGIDGIVCSPLEARAIRANSNLDSLLIVTPGMTPKFAEKAGDQKRTASPRDAMNDGVDLVVVGRGLLRAREYGLTRPEASQAVAQEIAEGLGN